VEEKEEENLMTSFRESADERTCSSSLNFRKKRTRRLYSFVKDVHRRKRHAVFTRETERDLLNTQQAQHRPKSRFDESLDHHSI
jgi:hypothetical protein